MVKRASYRRAVAWIAENDSAGDDNALDPQSVAELVTALLIADLFGVEPAKVGRDVVRYRERHGVC